MNILAIDASTKLSGYSTFIDNELIYGTIASTSTSPEKRIGIMRDGVIDLIKKYKIDRVVLEEVRPDSMNNRTGKVLNWLQGCLVIAIYEYDKNIKVDFIGSSSWRSVLGIQGYRVKREEQKARDIEWANKNYGLNLGASEDDAADAIGILSAYMKSQNIVVDSKDIKKKVEVADCSKSAF